MAIRQRLSDGLVDVAARVRGDGPTRYQRETARRGALQRLSFGVRRFLDVGRTSQAREMGHRARGSQDKINSMDRATVVRLAQWMFDNNETARGSVLRYGRLIGPQRPTSSNDAGRAAIKQFIAWAGSAEVRGHCGFRGLQTMMIRPGVSEGDHFGLLIPPRHRDEDGRYAPAAIQLLDGGLVCNPGGKRSIYDREWRDGIRVDAYGRPIEIGVAQWDSTGGRPTITVETRPAGSYLQFALRDRVSQTRGRPLLMSGLDKLTVVDEHTEAVARAALLHAALAVQVKSKAGGGAAAGIAATLGTPTERPTTDRPSNILEIEPGQAWFTDIEDEVKLLQAQQPQTTLEMFVEVMSRLASKGTGVTYEYLTGTFNALNFSQSKRIISDAYEGASEHREAFARVMQQLYEWWWSTGVLAGHITGLAAQPEALDIEWLPPPMPSYDDLGLIKGYREGIDSGLRTRRSIVESERGIPFEQHLDDLAEEQRLMAERGVYVVHAPGTSPASPPMPPDPETNKETEDANDTSNDTSSDTGNETGAGGKSTQQTRAGAAQPEQGP